MKLQEPYMFTGMQRDLSVSKQPAQFLYNGRNIRITSREGDTLLSITNEKSSKKASETSIQGTYLGHVLLNQYLVVFCVEPGDDSNTDLIYRIDLSVNPVKVDIIYTSNSNDDTKLKFGYFIEAIASFENKNVQKVYWTDGYNQPRMMNIVAPSGTYTSARDFDFVPELQLGESVTVKKLHGAGGEFPAGVIQYCFTYYNKYGHESNIFYTTPLYYISPKNRGAAPDEKVDNVFRITVTSIDTGFEYLRIYSILRTSLNGPTFCKRVQDIYIKDVQNNSVVVTDTGLMGEDIDPTELLYKGGESILAGTIEQKDNTLFLGNITLETPSLKDISFSSYNPIRVESIASDFRNLVVDFGTNAYYYGNQLSATNASGICQPCAGFKRGETYRLGVQFQYKNGRWSDPMYLIDKKMDQSPSIEPIEPPSGRIRKIVLPYFQGTIPQLLGEKLYEKGFRKVRGVIVFPKMHDRTIVCQGVLNPTLYTNTSRNNENSLYAQSSWFFRPIFSTASKETTVLDTYSPWPDTDTNLKYAGRNIKTGVPDDSIMPFNPEYLRRVEVQGYYASDNRFSVDREFCTLHSPEVEFDDQLAAIDYTSIKYRQVGNVEFKTTWSDIDIQTETPSVSQDGSGFVHKSFKSDNARGIVSGLFYDDYIVSGNRSDTGSDNIFGNYPLQKASAKWLIYPWQKEGSLNNDINRPQDMGVASAVLKRKIISNLRYADTKFGNRSTTDKTFTKVPQLFSSDENTIVKVGDNIYRGNVDTVLSPDESDGVYFAWDGGSSSSGGTTSYTPSSSSTPFDSVKWYKTFRYDSSEEYGGRHVLYWGGDSYWHGYDNSDMAGKYSDVAMKKGFVRMKYKSTPHIVGRFNNYSNKNASDNSLIEYSLPIVELVKEVTDRYGSWKGTNPDSPTEDALRENVWIPAGPPSMLSVAVAPTGLDVNFAYSWGDTYFQRYDCLKTYPFTEDDVNQIVEIGSFMLETHVNIDGRYDKNRGQLSNLYMRPRNFNLINPVYSQLNNFFTYRIMDDKFYESNSFPNQITWTKEKQSGADVDLWTNITLASTYDMDGSKGGVVSLNTWKDNIYCFQKKGVSNILFNSRVQIPTSDGMPIEISNNYKVDGYRYLSDGIGCNSPRLIKETPTGIYFIDSVSNHLFQIGDGINNITQSHNMSSVFRSMVFNKVLYDDVNRDLYLVNNTEALCYSEVLGQFTGFMNYGGASLIESYDKKVFGLHNTTLYELFAGDGYCNLFGVNRPWGLTFVSNGIGNNVVLQDKIFTNLEFRACVEGDGEYDENTGKFTFTLPFDSLEVWDEHQHGKTVLKDVSNMAKPMGHFEDEGSSLRRKFRIWRCDIPRNNAPIKSDEGLPNLFRKICKPLDRMRNPWLYVKLQKDAATEGQLEGTELHDIVMTYYS